MSSRCQILVVDDDLEDHQILLEYFREAGKESYVDFLTNGQEAIRFLEDAEESALPKLVVLDLNMPILNGTQTLLYLKELHRLKNIPVIVFSTSENENEKRKCLSLGAVDYLVKPTTYEEGERLVKTFISFIDPKPGL